MKNIFLCCLVLLATRGHGAAATCTDDWSLFGDHCYQMQSTLANWDMAKQTCLDLGSELLVVSSIEENIFVSNLGSTASFSTDRNKKTWMNCNNRGRSLYDWVCGENDHTMAYSNWLTNEPNSFATENCAEILTTAEGVWNDAICHGSRIVICEKRAVASANEVIVANSSYDIYGQLGPEFMIISDWPNRAIYATALDEWNFVQLNLNDRGNPSSIDYDHVSRRLFWTSSTGVHTARLDGTDGAIVSSLTNLGGIAVDPENENVYFGSNAMNSIYRMSYDGTGMEAILTDFGQPTYFSVSFQTREIFFQRNHTIYRVSMDGVNNTATLFYDPGDWSPIGSTTMDYDGSRLFWPVYDTVHSLSTNATSTQGLHNHSRYSSPYLGKGLSWHDDHYYASLGSVQRIVEFDDDVGLIRNEAFSFLTAVSDLKVVSSRQDPTGWECDYDVYGANLCGWSQAFEDNFDWRRLPRDQANHKDWFAMYANTTSIVEGNQAVLVSPYSDALNDNCLTFSYIMDGVASDASLNVRFRFEGNDTSVDLLTLSGDQGDAWLTHTLDVSGSGLGYFDFLATSGSEASFFGIDDVKFGPCNEHPVVTVGDVDLFTSCDGNMTVYIKKSTYESDTQLVRFRHSSCNAVDYNETHIALSTGFGACNTTVSSDSDGVLFSNIIEDTRSMYPEIIIECSLPRYMQLGTVFSPRSKVTITSRVYGTFSVEIDQYSTDQFNEIVNSDAPVEAYVGTELYFGTRVESNQALSISNVRCWATPSTDPDYETFRLLIENGASVPDSDVTIYDVDNLKAFSMEAFRFPGADLTYVHCDVLVCQPGDTYAACQQQHVSTGDRRKRRSARTVNGPHLLTRGPFVMTGERADDSYDRRLLNATLSTTSLMVVCLVAVGVIVVARRRESRDGWTKLPNDDVHAKA